MPGKKIMGVLPQEVNDVYLQLPVKMSHKDASAVPQTSPLASVGAAIVEIKPPAGAILLFMRPREAGLRIGDDNTHANGYESIYQGEWSQPIPVAGGDSVFIRIDAASGTTGVDFRFESLGDE